MLLCGRGARLLALSGLVAAVVGCGKKGPPLTPYVRIPAAIEAAEARRVGDEVYVTFAVPAQNVDASKPADVRRMEVYAVTTDAPRPANRLLEGATLVGVVSVVPTGPPGSTPLPPAPVPGAVPPPDRQQPVQGDVVTVLDRLEPEDLTPQPLAAPPGRRPPARTPVVPAAPAPPPVLQRSYVVVGVSARSRTSPPSAAAVVSLEPAPPPPVNVVVGYTPDAVTVTWNPSGGLLGFLLDRQLPPEILPVDEDLPRATAAAPVAPTLGPTRYNVYSQLAPDPLELPAAAVERPRWQRRPPRPVNVQPLDALQLSDLLEIERERCYYVRAIRGTGANAVEGPASQTACVRPVDVFPPEPPRGLSAVAGEGTISLIWEASPSLDVAGYLVLRGAPSDATLLPVTAVPVAETQFVDRAVTSGTRYVYAVVAVDARVPVPNSSEPSERTEETAR